MNLISELTAQEQMIRQQIIDRGIGDQRVLAALRAVPRENFFPVELRDTAYADRASPIGHGQNISQPYMVALMTARLQVLDSHKVLEIGTGSGYQTAILAKLAREVYTVERIKPLLDQAFEKLLVLGIRNVHFRLGDGTLGWPQAAPFDRILIAAAAPNIPLELLGQLTEGGIAVLPVGPSDEQTLVEIRKNLGKLEQTEICGCRFVKLIGREGWKDNDE